MADESLDQYRLQRVEQKAQAAHDRIDALEDKGGRIDLLERKEERRDDKMTSLERSNNRYAAACVALVVAIVGSAGAIILAAPK